MATVSSAPRTLTFTTVSTTAGPFNITFRLFDTDSLDVYLNGTRTTAFTVAATFSNGYTDSATLTLTTAVASGTQITIDGALTPRREADYLPGDPALTAKLNIELPRLWSALAEVKRDSERSVRGLGQELNPLSPQEGRTIVFDAFGQPTNGPSAAEISSANANGSVNSGFWIASVAVLLADTTYSYSAGAEKVVVAPGAIIQSRTEGWAYVVAASGAADHGLMTAGGVKLYVQPDADGRANLTAFGGIGNNAASNNAAITAAVLTGAEISSRPGRYLSTLPVADLPKRLAGLGQIRDTDGARAPNFVRQNAAPTSFGAPDNIGTRFDGDLSNLLFVGEKRITATNAFGSPTTGYLQRLENAAFQLSALNVAGHNESTSGNDGRTGSSVLDVRFTHTGQGDYGGIFVTGITTGVKPGATNFLASPAAVIMNGDLFSAADGGYMNILELNATDLGFRSAAIGVVFNFNRANAAATLGEVWMGVRPQSVNLASDVGYSLGGTWKRGLDLTDATLDGNAAAITLKSGQRIYFEAVASGTPAWSQVVGNDYISSDAASIVITYNGVPSLQVNDQQVTVASANGILVSGTGALRMADANQFTTGARTATFTATNKPGANDSAPAQWMRVILNGATFWVPCFPD